MPACHHLQLSVSHRMHTLMHRTLMHAYKGSLVVLKRVGNSTLEKEILTWMFRLDQRDHTELAAYPHEQSKAVCCGRRLLL